jgi:hypothetical protein
MNIIEDPGAIQELMKPTARWVALLGAFLVGFTLGAALVYYLMVD